MHSGRHLRLHRRRRRHHHHQGMERTSSKKPGAASLPDDLIAEILSRVPYKSLCCFKCVSRPWLALCSDPGVRRRCPQTLSCFFFSTLDPYPKVFTSTRHFVNASGRGPPIVDPSLSFLPPGHRDATIYDSCNGLLLCRFKDVPTQVGSRYFVGNPATEKWIDLPDTEPMKRRYPVIRLGFDPAVSSHFRVFPLVHDGDICHRQDRVTGLEIYSSGTGGWTYTPSEWGDGIRVFGNSRSAFFNSTLHLTTLDNSVIAVDTDGKTWRKILTPCNFDTIGLSQGRV
ncbi:hypothetical protein SEVIR_3G173900v4 [Setaria viridis]|uniref:F-box domain-containing protein n=2 Tax=Setaria viridis TaxID=4556 RepID=A0A4U6VEA5_SETVI|nr:hypothetical protein SEVIR_3G173900v2 [Setaria viridis]